MWAFALYITGGLGTFAGIGMIAFGDGWDILGWGDGRSLGYLFFCVGLCLSILGVLFMRLFRNRNLV